MGMNILTTFLPSLGVQHEHDAIPCSVVLPTTSFMNASVVITNRARHPCAAFIIMVITANAFETRLLITC